jgi:hypothetical protein
MVLGGLPADEEAGSDLAVRQAFSEQAQDFLLAPRQELERAWAGAALGPECSKQRRRGRSLAIRAEIFELAMRTPRDVDCELPFRVAERASQLEPSPRRVKREVHACELFCRVAEQGLRADVADGSCHTSACEPSGRL